MLSLHQREILLFRMTWILIYFPKSTTRTFPTNQTVSVFFQNPPFNFVTSFHQIWSRSTVLPRVLLFTRQAHHFVCFIGKFLPLPQLTFQTKVSRISCHLTSHYNILVFFVKSLLVNQALFTRNSIWQFTLLFAVTTRCHDSCLGFI